MHVLTRSTCAGNFGGEAAREELEEELDAEMRSDMKRVFSTRRALCPMPCSVCPSSRDHGPCGSSLYERVYSSRFAMCWVALDIGCKTRFTSSKCATPIRSAAALQPAIEACWITSNVGS